jgi:hypothetical protein
MARGTNRALIFPHIDANDADEKWTNLRSALKAADKLASGINPKKN